MYVRFKVSSLSEHGRGMKGIVETVRAVATASAGASISQPTGTAMFEVVSNTEAGGWTVDSSTTSASYSYSGWVGTIQINSPTNKTGYQKSLEVKANSTSSSWTNYGSLLCTFKVYDGSTVRYSGPLSVNSSNTTSSSSGGNMWMPNAGVYQDGMTWHFSCKADYAYLWFERDGSTSTHNFAGVSELQNVPASYLGSGNAFFPAVGFYGCSNSAGGGFGSSTSSYYHDYFAHSIHGSYANADDSPFDYVNANNVQYTGSGSFTTNDYPMQLGPYYYQGTSNAENANYNYKPIYNADGNKVGALVPAMYFNPYRGIPFTTLSGFYYYEPFQRSVDSWLALPSQIRQSEIIYDDTGAKYTLQYQPLQYTIRAFRSE